MFDSEVYKSKISSQRNFSGNEKVLEFSVSYRKSTFFFSFDVCEGGGFQI